MRIKKLTGILVLIAIGGGGIFVFLLYQTIKTKSTSLDRYEPFKQWIGKTVTLQKETVLFEEKLKLHDNIEYSYTLTDDLHPQFTHYKNIEFNPDYIITLPAGTILQLEKAVQYTNGTSGFSYPHLFGTISANGKTYKIGYQWGDVNQEKYFDKVDKCWKFHQAPWRTTPDTAWYALPEAKWW